LPWLRRLGNKWSVRRPGLNPRPVHVGFMTDRVALEQDFLPSFSVPLSVSVPPLLHTYSTTIQCSPVSISSTAAPYLFYHHSAFPCQYQFHRCSILILPPFSVPLSVSVPPLLHTNSTTIQCSPVSISSTAAPYLFYHHSVFPCQYQLHHLILAIDSVVK